MQQTNCDIKDLFLEISNGNRKAFETLFRFRYKKLVGFAQTLISERNLAEEVVSDVFVSLWMNRGKLTNIDNAETYLYVSVKNRCFNAVRNKPYTVAIDERTDVKIPEYENPQDAMEHRELYVKLNRLINELPEQQRIIFHMIKQNKLTARQTAEILQLSPRTVETHIYKAVKSLEEKITEYLGYSPKKKRVKRMIMLAI